jgi:hypothetical protein
VGSLPHISRPARSPLAVSKVRAAKGRVKLRPTAARFVRRARESRRSVCRDRRRDVRRIDRCRSACRTRSTTGADPERARLTRDELAKVDGDGVSGVVPGQLECDLGADFVAPPADGRPAVHCEGPLVRERAPGSAGSARSGDARRRAPPTGMKDRRRPRGMRDEHGDAVRHVTAIAVRRARAEVPSPRRPRAHRATLACSSTRGRAPAPRGAERPPSRARTRPPRHHVAHGSSDCVPKLPAGGRS